MRIVGGDAEHMKSLSGKDPRLETLTQVVLAVVFRLQQRGYPIHSSVVPQITKSMLSEYKILFPCKWQS